MVLSEGKEIINSNITIKINYQNNNNKIMLQSKYYMKINYWNNNNNIMLQSKYYKFKMVKGKNKYYKSKVIYLYPILVDHFEE